MDCAMFGILAQLVWSMQGSPYEDHVKGIHWLGRYSAEAELKQWFEIRSVGRIRQFEGILRANEREILARLGPMSSTSQTLNW